MSRAVRFVGIIVGSVAGWMFADGVLSIRARAEEPGLPRITQVWASSGVTMRETDSLAAIPYPDGRVKLFATSKAAHRIDRFDAATGKFERSIGGPGRRLGEFQLPNGIASVRFDPVGRDAGKRPATWLLLVVERDNARVQAIWPDDLSPAGFFGITELRRPYGLTISHQPDGVFCYVTDTRVRPEETVRMYRLTLVGRELRGTFIRSFGAASGPGVIHEAESIAVDERLKRVYVCDESPDAKDVKVYALDGRYLDHTFGSGLIEGDPEGIAVVDDAKSGCVVLTDRRAKITIWHLFEQTTLHYLGAFTGEPAISNTDGISVFADSFGRFEGGAMFAVNDDRDIRAYRLSDVRKLVAEKSSE